MFAERFLRLVEHVATFSLAKASPLDKPFNARKFASLAALRDKHSEGGYHCG
jgi:hypothetical protein